MTTLIQLRRNSNLLTAIKENIKWLGYKWELNVTHLIILINCILGHKHLILEGNAYVDSQSSEEIANKREHQQNQEQIVPFGTDLSRKHDAFSQMKENKFKAGESCFTS